MKNRVTRNLAIAWLIVLVAAFCSKCNAQMDQFYITATPTTTPWVDTDFQKYDQALRSKFGIVSTPTCVTSGIRNTDIQKLICTTNAISINGSDTGAWHKGGDILSGNTKFGSKNARDVIFISSGFERMRLTLGGHFKYTSNIYDTGDNLFLDVGGKAVYGNGGLLSLDAANSTLGVGSSISVDFGNNRLNDGAGNASILYGTRQQKNSAGTTVFEYENGTGYTAGGNLVLDLNNHSLKNGSTTMFNWYGPYIFYQSGNLAYDVGNGLQFASNGSTVMINHYNSSGLQLVPNTGNVVIGNTSNSGAYLDVKASDSGSASILMRAGTQPTSPVAGQMYFDGTHFYGYNGTTWKQLDN